MPILIINPTTDAAFVRCVETLATDATEPESLQSALREYYPHAVVRDRGLSSEREAWYVYRDGRWTSEGSRIDRTT